jgi:hypothetical protein
MKSFCMTAPVAPVSDCATGSGDKQSGDALAVFVSRPQVVKINAAALAWMLHKFTRSIAQICETSKFALCRATSLPVNPVIPG